MSAGGPSEGPLRAAAAVAIALADESPSGSAGALAVALGRLADGLGGAGVAAYGAAPPSDRLRLRAVAGADPGTAWPAMIDLGAAPVALAALREGRELGGRELGGLPPGALLVPARATGVLAGALAVVLPGGGAPGAAEREALAAVAGVLALWLRKDDLFAGIGGRVRALDRQVRELRAVAEITRAVARSLDEGEVRRVLVAEARRFAAADRVALLVPGDGGEPEPVAVEPAGAAAPGARLAATVAATGAPRAEGREVAVPVPLCPGGAPRTGRPAVLAAAFDGRGPDDDALDRLAGLAAQAGVALANARVLSELRQEGEERRGLSAALLLAQEGERRRVAEDLHDGPVQELVGLALGLDVLAAQVAEASPGLAGDVDRAAAAARDAVRALREAIFDLHPMALEELGLTAAARALVERLTLRGIAVTLDLAAAERLGEADRTIAFRTLQEAVANVVRHSGAGRVDIRARIEADAVVLEVRDDGRGFDADRPGAGIRAGHLGIPGSRERAALVGGRVEVESAPGRGALVRLVLPGRAGGADQAGGGSSRVSAA